jgi:hypothetical protein
MAIFMECLGWLEAGRRFVRRTLHSVPFVAKAVFRRVTRQWHKAIYDAAGRVILHQ